MKKQTQTQRQSLFQLLLEAFDYRRKPKPDPASLQERIEGCQTLEQLKTLLLSKEVVLDEQLMAAFDKRIAELEEQTGKSFLF
jgi:hypothetical protein